MNDTRVVLDSYAVLVFLGKEPGWEMVANVIKNDETWMTFINLGEVAYILERKLGQSDSDEMWTNFVSSGLPGGIHIKWLAADEELCLKAAHIKAKGGLSYADAFAAAAAQKLDCPVLTGDLEFASVETSGIKVRWLPGRTA